MRKATWMVSTILGLAFAGSAAARQGLGGTAQVEKQFREARPAYEKAVKSYSRRDYDLARRQLQDAIDAFPEFSDAHFLLAKSWYMQKRFDQALPAVELAESTWSRFATLTADARADQVEAVLQKRRNLQDQITALEDDLRHVTSDDERRRVETYIDTLRHQIDEIDRDRGSVSATELRAMPAEYFFVHGNILLRMNRLIDAEPQYLRAIEANPKYGEAFNNLASLYYQAGRLDDARKTIELARGRGLPVMEELAKAVGAQ